MILRKPYAFFIKIFRPIHIFMSFLTIYLIYKTNEVLGFFNSYIYSSDNVVGSTIKQELSSSALYVIPLILIAFSIVFLGIMYSKKKPVAFYVATIFCFLTVLIINTYCINFLGVMEQSIVSIKLVKLYHDLILINMIISVVIFVILIIRGLGINFKKFNFDSDLTKLNISDSDKEEFELNINLDVDFIRRNRKKRWRHLKYVYKENKPMVAIVLITVCLAAIGLVFLTFVKKSDVYKEGLTYSIANFQIMVNKTTVLKEDFTGKNLTDNNLIVIDFSLKTNVPSISLFSKDFSLEIGEARFFVQNKYGDDLLDIGNIYKNNILTKNYENYLLVFEIPDKYLNSEMFLVFNNEGFKTRIKLEPKKFVEEEIVDTKKVGENISFEKTVGDIKFTVNDFELKEKFLKKYNYCAGQECIASKEYIEPTINENFDKIVLRLEIDFADNSTLYLKKFYNFFDRFGAIHYKKNGKWYLQNNKFEELKSKKTDDKNNIYLGINADIYDADSIKMVFNIRNGRYEYILK